MRTCRSETLSWTGCWAVSETPNRDPLEARVITVSREALRADLLDLELRITKVITEGLSRKADMSYVQSLEARTAVLEREATRREGPEMARLKTTEDVARDLAMEMRERAQYIRRFEGLEREFADLKDEVLSETELRALAREERGVGVTGSWTTFGRVASVVALIIMVLSIWLAYTARSAASDAERGSDSAQIQVEHVLR